MELEKTAEGMGFNIMGGKEHKCPIYISRIIPGGYADRHGGLRRGDQLVTVNGQVRSVNYFCITASPFQSLRWLGTISYVASTTAINNAAANHKLITR